MTFVLTNVSINKGALLFKSLYLLFKICGFQNLKILFSDLLDQIALIFV